MRIVADVRGDGRVLNEMGQRTERAKGPGEGFLTVFGDLARQGTSLSPSIHGRGSTTVAIVDAKLARSSAAQAVALKGEDGVVR